MDIKIKSLKKIKKLEKEYNDTFNGIYKKIKKELKTEKLKLQIKLITSICQDYDLDYNEIYNKYISNNKTNNLLEIESISEEKIVEVENVLDRIVINEEECYLDANGDVFNLEAVKLGEFKDDKFIPKK